MQYFTFIGLGGVKGYSDVIYTFENEKEMITVSKFVQKPIIEKHKDTLNECIFFATKESCERYKEEIYHELKSEIDTITFEVIDKDITFDDFIGKLLERINENEEIILDITHSFRHIPMKLLFAIKYIEMSKNVTIKHLYYGKLLPRNQQGEDEEGVIIDFIKDYSMQNVSAILRQFDKTLTISSEEVEQVVEVDEVVERFLQSLFEFNQMIEFCEFDRCVKVVEKILQICRSIEKNQSNYTVIVPLVEKIRKKFEKFECQKNNTNRKMELIRVLLAHERYQIAITFTDQFFREEITRATLEPKNLNFNINQYFTQRGRYNVSNDVVYQLSNYFIFQIYQLREVSDKKKNTILYDLKLDEAIIKYNASILNGFKKTVEEFYRNIRNHINHGNTIQKKECIENYIEEMLLCVQKLERRD